LDYAKYVFDQEKPDVFSDTIYLNETAINVGIGYKYNDRSQIYFDYARSYRYPVVDEFFSYAYYDFWKMVNVPAFVNTSLKPQTANNFEIGIKDNSFDIVNFKMDYYFIDTKNEILYDPASGAFGANVNYPNTFRHGLELEVNGQLFDVVSAFLNYTYQQAKFAGGSYSGKNIPLVPSNKISFGFNIKPIESVNIDLISNYIGQRVAGSDMDNSGPKLKSAFVTDLNIEVKVKDISIVGSIKNMFGAKYFSSGFHYGPGADYYYPASERRYELSVSCVF
jgi:iron complex outermembrane receptor protein